MLLAPLLASGQEENNRINKWSVGLNLSAAFNDRVIQPVYSNWPGYQGVLENEAIQSAYDSLSLIEKGKTGLTIGALFSRQLTKRMELITGINISDKGYKSKGFIFHNYIVHTWFLYKQSGYTRSARYYWEAPVLAQYNFKEIKSKGINFHLFGGVAICANNRFDMYSRQTIVWMPGDSSYHVDDLSRYTPMRVKLFQKIKVGGIAGGGMSLKLNNGIRVLLDAEYKYYVEIASPYNQDIKEIVYSYGGRVTLIKSL